MKLIIKKGIGLTVDIALGILMLASAVGLAVSAWGYHWVLGLFLAQLSIAVVIATAQFLSLRIKETFAPTPTP